MGVFQQKKSKNVRRPYNWRSHFRPQSCRRKNYVHEAFLDLWTTLRAAYKQLGHPQTRHETPTRHETTYFAQSTPWPRTQRNLWCSAVFKAMNFNAPSITDINPTRNNMKNITRSALNPTWNHKPNVKQRLLGPSLHWCPQIPPQCHPTRNTPDMKQRHLWGDFQLQPLSRLRARDVPATCSNNVVSCGVWFHRGFVVLWTTPFFLYIKFLHCQFLRFSISSDPSFSGVREQKMLDEISTSKNKKDKQNRWKQDRWTSTTCRGFSNVPWRKRAFGAGTKYGFFEEFWGILRGLVYGEGGAPGTVPLHNLRVTSHVLHQEVPLGWYRVRLFWIIFGHSSWPCPKDPAVLKILRRSKFARRSKFTIA